MSKPFWVFVAGAYRTASTTQYQMARDIVEQTKHGIGIGYHTERKLKEFDEKDHELLVCKVFEFLPEGFRGERSMGELFLRGKRLKALCTIRDPRDIIVSMRKRASDLGKRMVNGKVAKDKEWSFIETATVHFPVWLGQLDKWISLGPAITMVTRYEEMITNLFRETKRIAEHLNIPLDTELAKQIAKEYTIDRMNEKKEEMRGKKADPWLPSIPAIVFGTAGLHKSWLSNPERKIVEDANRDFMKKYGYL
jgi:hypothetical protein